MIIMSKEKNTKASLHAEKTTGSGKIGKQAEKTVNKKGVLDKGPQITKLLFGVAIYQGAKQNKINTLTEEIQNGYEELQNAERYAGQHHTQSLGDIYERVKLDLKKDELAKQKRKLMKLQQLTNTVFSAGGRAMGGMERIQRTMLQKQTYDAMVKGDTSGAARENMVFFDAMDNCCEDHEMESPSF